MLIDRCRRVGFIGFLTTQEPLGFAVRIERLFYLFILFVFLPLLLTWGGARVSTVLFNMEAVEERVMEMLSVDFQATKDRAGVDFNIIPIVDVNAKYAGVVIMAPGTLSEGINPCAPNSPPEHLCLLNTRRFPDVSVASFQWIEFPATAFAIPELIVDFVDQQNVNSGGSAASNGNRSLSQRDKQEIKRIAERELSQSGPLFLPNESKLVYFRIINGPIQYVTIFLAWYAMVVVWMRYLQFVYPNKLIRSFRSLTFSNDEIVGIWGDGLKPPKVELDEKGRPEGQQELPTPWFEPLTFSDYNQATTYYMKARDKCRDLTSFRGFTVDAPILRFRRAACQAVENTGDVSIVPQFLDAQRDSFLSLSDAKNNQLRFLTWGIPTIGFIGTVVGISGALVETISLQSQRDLVASVAQGTVSSFMGMAFDTTLVALVAAFLVMFMQHFVQEQEEISIARERDAAEDDILGSVRIERIESATPQGFLAAVDKLSLAVPSLAAGVSRLEQSAHSLALLRRTLRLPAEHENSWTKGGFWVLLVVVIVGTFYMFWPEIKSLRFFDYLLSF